jgi:hypothetical protein
VLRDKSNSACVSPSNLAPSTTFLRFGSVEFKVGTGFVTGSYDDCGVHVQSMCIIQAKAEAVFLGLFFKVPELNDPEEFVASSMTCPLAMSVIVTLAPLITAPKGLLAVPTMPPVPTVVCEMTGRNSTAQRLAAVRNPGYARVFWRQRPSGALCLWRQANAMD